MNEINCKEFPDLNFNFNDRRWLRERFILAPTNEIVDHLNFTVQEWLSNKASKTYLAIDKTLDDDQATRYPTEFLNSLPPAGFPSYSITLKVGSPIKLQRNLNPPKLCYGTRLVAKALHRNLTEATILTGIYSGEDDFIPHIKLRIDGDPNLVYEFERDQFPMRLAYSMSMNKY